MTCPYCADGTVYDLWFTDGRWQQQRLGRCKHCAGGDCEPGRLVRTIAEHTGEKCVKVIYFILRICFEYRLKGHEQLGQGELMARLEQHYPGLQLEDRPLSPGPEATPEPTYDFGDGWVPEQDGVPF